MALIEHKGTRGYFLVESYRDEGGKVRHRRLYLGTTPPWPKSQGWSGLSGRQVATLKKRAAQRKANRLPKVAPPTGQYRTIVIDPPWPMERIEREVRPNQVTALEYPTMSVEEIGQIVQLQQLAAADGCHVYLWTTHRFLPDALSLFQRWGVRYECLLTWVKNVGFTPFSFMYTTEHVLFGRVGSLPLERKGRRLDFSSRVNGHSRKPTRFYNLVRDVSPAPRLDMFSREGHKGFAVWGNQEGMFDAGQN